MKIRIAKTLILLTAITLVVSCKTATERLQEEARAEARKFWETRVFSKCEGGYFGNREGTSYQFHSPTAVVIDDSAPSDVYEWYGKTLLLSSRWRAFESGKWQEWQEEKIVSPGLITDPNRSASIIKGSGVWSFGYDQTNPAAYHSVSCGEVELILR